MKIFLLGVLISCFLLVSCQSGKLRQTSMIMRATIIHMMRMTDTIIHTIMTTGTTIPTIMTDTRTMTMTTVTMNWRTGRSNCQISSLNASGFR